MEVARAVPVSRSAPHGATPSSVQPPDKLDQVLSSVYFHGIPIQESESALASTRSVQRLTSILSDHKRSQQWENATILLGLSGDPAAYDTLVGFLRRDDSTVTKNGSKPISEEMYYAKSNVPVALGLLAYKLDRGSPDLSKSKEAVLKFLKTHSTPTSKTWMEDVRWRTEKFSNELMYADLGAQCLQGLALSGTHMGREYLDWVADHIDEMRKASAVNDEEVKIKAAKKHGLSPELLTEDFFRSFRATVDNAKKTNDAIAGSDLRSYYARNRNPQ